MSPEDVATVTRLADEYVAELHDGRLAYRPHEAARLLGVDERTVRRLIVSGHLHAIRPSGRLTLIPRDSLYAFLGVDAPQPQAATS